METCEVRTIWRIHGGNSAMKYFISLICYSFTLMFAYAESEVSLDSFEYELDLLNNYKFYVKEKTYIKENESPALSMMITSYPNTYIWYLTQEYLKGNDFKRFEIISKLEKLSKK